MRRFFTSTDESASKRYQRLVLNNPTRRAVDKLTQSAISKKLAKKDLKELHDIVKELDDSNYEVK